MVDLKEQIEERKKFLEKIETIAEDWIDNRAAVHTIWLPQALESGLSKTDFLDIVKGEAKNIRERRREEERAEARRRAKQEKKRAVESLPDDVPTFERGDYAEVAMRLVQKIVSDTGEKPTKFRRSMWTYAPELGRWVERHDDEMSQAIQGWAGRGQVLSGEKPKPLMVNNVETPIKMAKSLTARWGRGEGWLEDTAHRALSFTNGTFVVCDRGGEQVIEMRQSSPHYKVRHGYDFDIDLESRDERWESYLSSMVEGADDGGDRLAVLQEFFGASLMGIATDFNKALLMHGPKGSGKSTLVEVLSTCFVGEVSAVQMSDWDDIEQRGNLSKSRLNVINEMSYKDLKDANMVKRIVSGDRVSGKILWKQAYDFVPEAGHVITTNPDQLPTITNADPAFWDRWQATCFTRQFRGTEEQDATIGRTLVSECKEAIVAWMLRGAMRVTRRGRYTVCPSGERVIRKWRGEANSVAQFFTDATVESEAEVKSDLPPMKEIYDWYVRWCKAVGIRKSAGLHTFSKRAKAMGHKYYRNRSRCTREVKTDAKRMVRDSESQSSGSVF